MQDTVVESASMKNEMSRKATMEYVGVKRRAYSVLKSKTAKTAAIDDFCRSRAANALASGGPCVPGDTQVDTVALCGGDMGGSFFWGLTVTDRLTQWAELRGVWNRGAAATKESLADAVSAFPFPLTALHSDSGMEFINAHVLGYARDRARPLAFTRSRPGNKNDNARVEQKNASVVREYFGYERIDRLELKKDMDALCAKISLYNNLFRPCKRIVSKTKRPDAHGFAKRYDKRYDKPATPLDRAAASGSVV